ncbi:hypothetical protein RND81_11G064100 [Saponaria officinalis]|uniref:PB1 domain-containing protein n=1 Tax=Saponaria officinalis TaxID=3572 RepID=A0AAW1HIX4_SAPOF
MDPPPAPPISTTTYPDSIDSSPRSRATDFDDPPHPTTTTTATKLRLMCSYGGHIIPRPHDKSLCYVGGDTRMVVIDRTTTLSDLLTRLSKTLLNHQHTSSFHLKYQLPNEDLDSLITVSTDEDLDNLIDEYDRLSKSSTKPGRIRLFLFPSKPDVAHSVGPILDGSNRSEDWFLNALNGASELHRGYSDPAVVNSLLGLDHDVDVNINNINNNSFNSNNNDNSLKGEKKVVNSKSAPDVNSVPDSPIIDTTSSFGSTSSPPSFVNLPPIRVHVDQRAGGGIEEQFAQMLVGGEFGNRMYSDDERSEQGVAGGFRKQQQLGQSVVNSQAQQKQQLGTELPSPDSVSSDSSLSSAIARQKSVMYQDSNGQISSGSNRHHQGMQVQQVSESGYGYHQQYEQHQQQMLQQHQHQQQQQQHQHQQQQQNLLNHQQHQQQQQGQTQQQYIPTGSRFVQHHPHGSMPMQNYYPMYPPQQQQQQQHHQPHQYPVYYVSAGQGQGYSLQGQQQQPNMGETPTSVPSNRTQNPSNPAIMTASSTYNPTRMNLMPQKSELGPAVYRTTTAANITQLQSQPQPQQQQQQQQQQFVGYSQNHHPSQSIAPNTGGASNYAYEFADPARSQMYYTQPLSPALASQYQGVMLGGPTVMMSDGSSQLSNDNGK